MNREQIIRIAREAGAIFDNMAEAAAIAPIFERFAALVAAEKEKQIIYILERLQERNDSHNYYGYAIKVIAGEI